MTTTSPRPATETVIRPLTADEHKLLRMLDLYDGVEIHKTQRRHTATHFYGVGVAMDHAVMVPQFELREMVRTGMVLVRVATIETEPRRYTLTPLGSKSVRARQLLARA